MRKLLMLLFAVSLFVACNNKKEDSRDRRATREKDDYRSKDDDTKSRDDDRDSRKTEYKDDRDNNSKDEDKFSRDRDDDRTISVKKWPNYEIKAFIDNCAREAQNKGLTRSQAMQYCECMQVGIEKLYPDINDAANLDLNSPRIQKMIEECTDF